MIAETPVQGEICGFKRRVVSLHGNDGMKQTAVPLQTAVPFRHTRRPRPANSQVARSLCCSGAAMGASPGCRAIAVVSRGLWGSVS